MAKQNVTNCRKTRGYPFVMAYLFTKQGTQVYCGSLDYIWERTSSLPTCHGMVHYYRSGRVAKRDWQLFGFYTVLNHSSYFHLDKMDRHTASKRHDHRSFIASELNIRRPKYALWFSLKTGDSFAPIEEWCFPIRSWRKLPSTYLTEFDNVPIPKTTTR